VTRLVAGLLLIVAAPVMAGGHSAKPYVDAFKATRLDGRLAVSFRVTNGLEAEALDKLRSGLPVAQQHRVELLGRKQVMWPAKVYARIRIDTFAEYDTLTKRYDLSRTIRAGPAGKKKFAVVTDESHSTYSVDEVRRWMTEFAELPALTVPAVAQASRLRVRVESTLGRRFVLNMFPAKSTVSAERRLNP
jgi:hypothetical protein